MALAIAKKGMDVAFTYHTNKAAADDVEKEIRESGVNVYPFQLDTCVVQSFDSFVKDFTAVLQKQRGDAKIDFLINNAGTALYALATEVTEQQLDSIFDIHYKGVFFLTQKMLPHINDGGGIINISSGLTRITYPGLPFMLP